MSVKVNSNLVIGITSGLVFGCGLGFVISYKQFQKSKVDNESQLDDDVVELDVSKTYKMVLVVRQDIKMGKGKVASQCSHATLG